MILNNNIYLDCPAASYKLEVDLMFANNFKGKLHPFLLKFSIIILTPLLFLEIYTHLTYFSRIGEVNVCLE